MVPDFCDLICGDGKVICTAWTLLSPDHSCENNVLNLVGWYQLAHVYLLFNSVSRLLSVLFGLCLMLCSVRVSPIVPRFRIRSYRLVSRVWKRDRKHAWKGKFCCFPSSFSLWPWMQCTWSYYFCCWFGSRFDRVVLPSGFTPPLPNSPVRNRGWTTCWLLVSLGNLFHPPFWWIFLELKVNPWLPLLKALVRLGRNSRSRKTGSSHFTTQLFLSSLLTLVGGQRL